MSSADRLPSYCRHKASDRGYARFGGAAGKPTYFPGPFGSAESRSAYDRELAAWLARGRHPAVAATGLTVAGLVDAWLGVAETLYVKNGRPTSEVHCQRAACRPLVRLFAAEPAADFAPQKLGLVRAEMARRGWAAGTVRHHVARVKSLFGWAVDQGLVPPATHAALVAGRKRRLLAAEQAGRARPKKKPADPASVAAVLAGCRSAPLRALVELQRLNGMRPGEVCALRPCDLDRSGPEWCYRVALDGVEGSSKSEHHGAEQIYWLGPRSQAVLAPFLGHSPDPTAPLFRPVRAKKRAGYTVNFYRLSIVRLVRRLNRQRARDGLPLLAHWSPHQLRHSHGTEVRAAYGAEAAQARLGHKHLSTTELYAQRNSELARRVARELG